MEDSQRRKNLPPQADGRTGNGRITPRERLMTSALRLLSARPHSSFEIITHLKKKSADVSLIEEIVASLVKSKYLDDEKFAVWVVESYARSNPKGQNFLVMKLRQKGISPDIIEKAISQNTDAVPSAELLLIKKSKNWGPLSPRDFKIKATRLLYSRGFPWSVIESVLKKRYN